MRVADGRDGLVSDFLTNVVLLGKADPPSVEAACRAVRRSLPRALYQESRLASGSTADPAQGRNLRVLPLGRGLHGRPCVAASVDVVGALVRIGVAQLACLAEGRLLPRLKFGSRRWRTGGSGNASARVTMPGHAGRSGT
jgi:hypothetical protein